VATTNSIVDLSVEVNPDFWEPEPVRREILDHKAGADKLGQSYLYFRAKGFWHKLWIRLFRPRRHRIGHQDFPDGMGLSLMSYRLTTHTGTHIDAPYHYGWRAEANDRPKTVTDIPLSWCYGRGVLLDFSDTQTCIDAAGVQEECRRIGHQIEAGDIVLLNTGAFRRLGTREYFTNYRAIDRSALAWLIERGVRVIGTDGFSFDRPFCDMIDDYKRTGDKDVLWPAHFYGRDHEYIQIERLGNLDELPNPTGFQVCCFPIKLTDADAAWSRVVAILD
jgi:cyclase